MPNDTSAPKIPAWTDGLRELVAAIISLAIVFVTLAMLWQSFGAAGLTIPPLADGKPNVSALEALQRQKDILLLAVGFFGAVTGYYLGRAPAEKQADAARQQADVARDAQKTAEKNAADTKIAAGRFESAVAQIAAGNKPATGNELAEAVSKFRLELK